MFAHISWTEAPAATIVSTSAVMSVTGAEFLMDVVLSLSVFLKIKDTNPPLYIVTNW